MDVRIEESIPALAADSAELFVDLAQQAIDDHRQFKVALSGGSTPKLLYGLLTSDTFRSEVQWDRILYFFGDERWVPHNNKESNYKLAKDELFSKIGISLDIVFPMPTEGLSPDEAAAQYAATVRKQFGTADGEVPVFDLIFLGMGDDGHTASLFPHTDAVHERTKLVAAPYVEKLASHRITLTPPVLQAARNVIFMVTGDTKAAALKQVLEGPRNIDEYPSQLLREAKGRVIWMVDRAAAAQLEEQYTQA
jgi:6-phosphogluconolactonase